MGSFSMFRDAIRDLTQKKSLIKEATKLALNNHERAGEVVDALMKVRGLSCTLTLRIHTLYVRNLNPSVAPAAISRRQGCDGALLSGGFHLEDGEAERGA